MRKSIIPALILFLLLSACEKKEPDTAERGYIISTRLMREYTPEDIQQLLDNNNFEVPFTLEHNVKAIKIAYMTTDPAGRFVNATGGIYIPETSGEFPIISYQHGTQSHRVLVPSYGAGNSDAGLAGAVSASMGYVCVAADYLGLGESEIVPPYLLAENSATTVIDMLRAGSEYLTSQGILTDGSLYLTGYSQGGHVTMAAHHELERNYGDEFEVTASAPLAGPYDLKATLDTIMKWESYANPVLFAYLMNSFNYYYEWDRLSEIFQEPFASDIPAYFDGGQFMNAINENLPRSIDNLLTSAFIESYRGGGETDFKEALQDNSLLSYTPAAPVLLVHGEADMTVPYENSVSALKYYMSKGKTNVDLITVTGDHEGAAPDAIVAAMSWFESIRQK